MISVRTSLLSELFWFDKVAKEEIEATKRELEEAKQVRENRLQYDALGKVNVGISGYTAAVPISGSLWS